MAALIAALLLSFSFTSFSSTAQARPWPSSKLDLGAQNAEGDVKTVKNMAPFRFRYTYLAGGVNTSNKWQNWANGNGSFVSGYIKESYDNNLIPVFSYYEMRQSLPGANNPDEPSAVLGNLRNEQTMRAYYEDLKMLFQRANGTKPVVIHIEPDLWGYVQQHGGGDNASQTPAVVSGTRMPDLAGLPNNVSGFAQAVVRLRNNYAKNVVLGYSLSVWGTNKDIAVSNESITSTSSLASRSVSFYKSLGARYDVMFAEFADRDSAYAQNRDGKNPDDVWWNKDDFVRHTHYLTSVHKGTKLDIVLWQIPVGNTVSRSMNNTPGHYQDNRVQWLLGSKSAEHLKAYRKAGVVSLMFGSGQAEGTGVGDVQKDGITNPRPITGNNRIARHADDDGGYLRGRARAYYKSGPLRLK